MASGGALPRHWIEGYDDNHQRVYYFHTLTRRSTWTRPVDEETPVTMAATPATAAASPATGTSEWIQVYSAEHDRNFYYNKVTRQSVWTDPASIASSLGGGGTPSKGRVVMQSAQVSEPRIKAAWDAPVLNGDATLSYASIASSPVTTQQRQSAPPLNASPLLAAGSPMAIGGTTGASMRQQPSSDADFLENELEMYTRDLYRQSQAMGEHVQASWAGTDRDQVTKEATSMADAARALLKGTTRKRGLEGNEYTLATWGDQPPTILEVKKTARRMRNDLKYVEEELKAQGEAKAEAVAADAEGGYYTILGVPTNADAAALKKAFRAGMIKWHPDKMPMEERQAAQDKANLLQSAYNCLSSPWERYLYDWLGLKRYLYHVKVIQSFKNYMLTGFPVTKHPRKGYPRLRTMWISPDWAFLQTAPERILEPDVTNQYMIKGVRITDVHDVVRGITTEVFERTGAPKKQNRYFSIIASDRTLDIECETKERCDFLFSRISMLVFDTQQNRKWAERFFEVDALQKARAAASAAKSGKAPPPHAPQPPQGERPTPPPGPTPPDNNN